MCRYRYSGKIDSSGAIITLNLALPRPYYDTIHSVKEIAGAIPVKALIDTGVNITAIRPRVVEQLNLELAGSCEWQFLTKDSNAIIGIYTVCVFFDNGPAWLKTLVGCTENMQPTVDCVIGRDILDKGIFVFDGPNGTYRLEFS